LEAVSDHAVERPICPRPCHARLGTSITRIAVFEENADANGW
jgi:hypothetical protein